VNTQWNGEEDTALQGCSLLAQVIYLRGLRRYMNYQTGIVGKPAGRAIGMNQLAQIASFSPDWGSKKKSWTPDKAEVRAALDELKRHRVIEDRGSNQKDGLIFFLPMAKTVEFAPKRNNTGTTQEQHTDEQHKEHTAEAAPDKASDDRSDTQNNTGTAQDESGRNSTKQISDIEIHNPPNACAHEDTPETEQEPEPNDGLPKFIPRKPWEDYKCEWELKKGRQMSLTQIQALWQQLASLDREGYDAGKALDRAVAFGFWTFDRKPETLKDEKTPTTGQGASGSFNQQRRGSNYEQRAEKQQRREDYRGFLREISRGEGGELVDGVGGPTPGEMDAIDGECRVLAGCGFGVG
jgi:hypothetical protein